MEKININHLIVVEGCHDEAYIKTYFNCFTYSINGLDINQEKISFLCRVKKVRNIILLLDSDEEGKRIREKINNLLPDCINVELDINKCNKNNKHGVHECEKEELIFKLKPFEEKEFKKGEIDYPFLYSLNYDFDIIKTRYGIGNVNNKKLVNLLNCLLVKKKDLKNGNQ